MTTSSPHTWVYLLTCRCIGSIPPVVSASKDQPRRQRDNLSKKLHNRAALTEKPCVSAALDASSGLTGARHAKCHAIFLYSKPVIVCNERAESRNTCSFSHLQACALRRQVVIVMEDTVLVGRSSLVRLPSRNKAGTDGNNSVASYY